MATSSYPEITKEPKICIKKPPRSRVGGAAEPLKSTLLGSVLTLGFLLTKACSP